MLGSGRTHACSSSRRPHLVVERAGQQLVVLHGEARLLLVLRVLHVDLNQVLQLRARVDVAHLAAQDLQAAAPPSVTEQPQ